ncbi:hypothetical protein JZO81_03935 [Enterococcus hulanensis]|nr:hypothetical protein [Enterococcus hulanensis]
MSLSGLLFFSIMNLVVLYWLVPKMTRFLERISLNIRFVVCILLLYRFFPMPFNKIWFSGEVMNSLKVR